MENPFLRSNIYKLVTFANTYFSLLTASRLQCNKLYIRKARRLEVIEPSHDTQCSIDQCLLRGNNLLETPGEEFRKWEWPRTGKLCMSIFAFFLPYPQDHGSLRSINSAAMLTTWRNDFFSLLRPLRPTILNKRPSSNMRPHCTKPKK